MLSTPRRLSVGWRIPHLPLRDLAISSARPRRPLASPSVLCPGLSRSQASASTASATTEVHPHRELFSSFQGNFDRLTRLPTPRPIDDSHGGGAYSRKDLAMSDVADPFFASSRQIEDLSILTASISTGLIRRAEKVFTNMRMVARAQASEMEGEARQPYSALINSLDVHLYNTVIEAYLKKALSSESQDDASYWVQQSHRLFEDMLAALQSNTSSVDPPPNVNTFALYARGVVSLNLQKRFPSDLPGLAFLLSSARLADVNIEAMLTSSIFTNADTEVDHVGAQVVLDGLRFHAKSIQDERLWEELNAVSRSLRGDGSSTTTGRSVEQLPPLLPQLSTSKGARAAALESGDPNALSEEGVKSFNLAVLQANLSFVQEAKMHHSDPVQRQRWLEESALDAAQKRLQHGAARMEELGLGNAGAMQSQQLQVWMWDWYQKLEKVLSSDIRRVYGEDEDRAGAASFREGDAAKVEQQIAPYLRLLTPKKLALITILELMRMMGTGAVSDGLKTTRALISIGRAVEVEHHSTVMARLSNLSHAQRIASAAVSDEASKPESVKESAAARDLERQVEAQSSKWTQQTRARVGSFLVQRLMEVATVNRRKRDETGEMWDQDQPAFYAAYQYLAGKRLGVIKLNEVVAKRLDRESVQDTIHPRHLPMLVKPKTWTTHESGGYMTVRTSAMRFKASMEQGTYLKKASMDGKIDVVLSGLDVLGQTPWRINRSVYDVVTEVWNSGDAIANMPPKVPLDPEPEKPVNYASDLKARSVYLQRLKAWNLQRISFHSQRCDVNYKLEIARAYMGERFYFPHNMDFRGRAYPIPPHLNHIGNDLCRGLLLFDDAKPLGTSGLKWLRIHLANVYGFDKASFSERHQFALDHEADIRDSVENPLSGRRWWVQADDPWQCLATCFELYAAYTHPDGPEAFPSRLPVHQDGTCNGLQHYAALGGDIAGAKQVNLAPSGDRPSDVYSGVADLVIAEMDEAARQGNELAKKLQGKVTRKVVKQTVMTTVYGVTFVGAKNQVTRQLNDRGDIAPEDLYLCGSYLAKTILSCIGDLFSGAEAIQVWLTHAARMIAKSIPPDRVEDAAALLAQDTTGVTTINRQGRKVPMTKLKADTLRMAREQMTSVIWTTALGLPVVQPYRKDKKKQIVTAMQTVFIQDPHVSSEVSPQKQASAFPPNFIHSLDATHMILTAIECQTAGLTFASVHDSYWTHACDIDTMSDLIRETFVRLHSAPILENLRHEILTRYKGFKIPVVALRTNPKFPDLLAKVGVGVRKSAVVMDEASLEALDRGEQILPHLPSGGGLSAREEALDVAESATGETDSEDLAEALDDSMRELTAEVDGAGMEAVEEQSAATRSPPLTTNKIPRGQDFATRFVDIESVIPDVPSKGTFDVREIKHSQYFFS